VTPVLIAWTAQGVPRWVKAIANPPGVSECRFRNALLQSDGSILVGLAGDDADADKGIWIRTSAYFCRLLPGTFDLDRAFGGGHVVRRLPGEDQPSPIESGDRWLDYQLPDALHALGTNAIIGAVSCRTRVSTAVADLFNSSPDLLADGSVGMVRLV
jgi:hypothetical protein